MWDMWDRCLISFGFFWAGPSHFLGILRDLGYHTIPMGIIWIRYRFFFAYPKIEYLQ